ncbi:MAG: GNAT family N-acetyltransferase [Bacteroidales bacterium]|jgi:ribosomal protein S18 acetylase RimI-like enzyme|nr:GNAT family N-acetyltransferase [Bacteroidales bacterium]
MEIIKIESADYKKYGEALVNLYLATFSEGESFQYHNRKETELYLQSILEVGYGIIAIEDQDLLGSILLTPLHFDNLVPASITQNFNLSHSIYVTEMMVKKSNQGRGIGKKLLLHFLETVDRKTYHHAFIRVWIQNTAAVGLYKKMGFNECATIEQSKLLADKGAVFNFKKSYLHQKLT